MSIRSSRWRRPIRPSSPTPSSGRRACDPTCRRISPTCSSGRSAWSTSRPRCPRSSASSSRSPGAEGGAPTMDLTDLSAVADIVRPVPGWHDADPVITPLAGGITNRNYRVEIDGACTWCGCPASAPSCSASIGPARRPRRRSPPSSASARRCRAELPGVGTLVTEFVGGTPATTDALLAPGVLERVVDADPAVPRQRADRRQLPDLPRRRVARPRRGRQRRRRRRPVYDELHDAARRDRGGVRRRARWSRRCATTTCCRRNVLFAATGCG